MGTLRIYLDCADDPVIEAPMETLLSGRGPFPNPFAYDSAMGYNLYFPIPYQEHVRVTVENPGALYYQVGYRTYEPGTPVETFSDAARQQAGDVESDVVDRLRRVAPIEPGEPASGETAHAVVSTGGAPLQIDAPSPGAVTRLQIQTPTTNDLALRETILSIKVDGVETVRAPVGDFFGGGPGLLPHDQLLFSIGPSGMTSRVVMPFGHDVQIALESGGQDSLAAASVDITYCPLAADPGLRFFARWRRIGPMDTRNLFDVTFLEVESSGGHYLGNALDATSIADGWWGEGDENIYLDDADTPALRGTGTEDYYGYGWGDTTLFSRPYHAQLRSLPPSGYVGRTAVNRFHVLDRIEFADYLRFDMEIWSADRAGVLTYDVVNYWYAAPDEMDDQPSNPPTNVLPTSAP